MIVYFDTSALIPLLVDEPGSEAATRLWSEADHVVSVRLIYAEARAALARARRLGRLQEEQLPALTTELASAYDQLDRVDIDDALVRRAGELAQLHELRGYDAVHLGAVERIADDRTVFASGDQDLCGAAGRLGIATSDTSSATTRPGGGAAQPPS